ncbi:MAG TPA: hypothetical protein ENG42_01110 [Candidatus Aenigmarchaeota archaeon]|nr:MAG: hypothetical protein DRP03_00620 [Candidatus Aenigmarchaeota archaeon]HDD46050.1 hypothetical protein [Candidatus Aenigmarchaeota archaeon]
MEYRSAGVDIELGNKASRILYNAARITWENRKGRLGEVVEISPDFSGIRGINVGMLPKDTYMGMGFDGVGTKIEIAERARKHDTVAYDLFAMVCDDASRIGAEPVIIGSILDVNTLCDGEDSYIDLLQQLAKGYIDAAKEANVAVVNGEVAEVGARVRGYGEFNYNWGASVIWFARKNNLITGKDIKKGDRLVALREHGFRSNGISLVRRIMETAYGKEWHNEEYYGQLLGDLVLIPPSRIYTPAIVDMCGGAFNEPKAEVHSVAHITGGGIPEKLGRVLKNSEFGAYIEDPFEPFELMLLCQEKGNVSDREAYMTWNMGQGMIIITREPEKVIKIASNYGIEAKVIGEVIEGDKIIIKSKGLHRKGKELIYKK